MFLLGLGRMTHYLNTKHVRFKCHCPWLNFAEPGGIVSEEEISPREQGHNKVSPASCCLVSAITSSEHHSTD